MLVNGHQTYLPKGNGQEWILCDNYADTSCRLQTPYLYHIPSNRRIDIGNFKSPPEYSGMARDYIPDTIIQGLWCVSILLMAETEDRCIY